MWLQILFTIFVALVSYNLFTKKKTGKLTWQQFLGWLAIWLIALVVFWLPNSTNYFANVLGIGRGADLILYLSIIVLFYMQYRNYLIQAKHRSEITKIVRQIALNDGEKKNDN